MSGDGYTSQAACADYPQQVRTDPLGGKNFEMWAPPGSIVFRIWVSGVASYLFDDLVDVVGEERGPLAVARVDVLVHDLHAVE